MELIDGTGQWRGGFLDQTVVPGSVRLDVVVQAAVASAADQFFVRPRDLRMVLAYLRAFGPTRVLRKVRSRQSEDVRNDAWLSVGLGRVLDSDGNPVEGEGPVVFVATSAPRAAERMVIPAVLVRPGVEVSLPSGPRHFVGGVDVHGDFGEAVAEELGALVGWQPEEGTEPQISQAAWERLARVLSDPPSRWEEAPSRPRASMLRERVDSRLEPDDRPEYHVFGLGQYAKVNAIANLDRRLRLVGIHEVNPAQLGPVPEVAGPALDTSPIPRAGEKITNAVLAGYHHTHGPLAVALLDAGARHIIIEKPVTTTDDQLDDLLAAMDRNPQARVHVAFQRRHAPFNRLIRRDLGSGPISMSAVVYEVPLPARHWYRWPVVGNSVVSNGCHWIDYFCHLNDYVDIVDHRAMVLSDQVMLVMETANGASCTISLRHSGSPRLGVRDLITLWKDDSTVTIEDNSRYRSEQGFSRLRTASCQRLQAHEDMYTEFARRIADDLAGDSRRSIEVSTRAMTTLAALVDQARGDRQ